jgi:hypothetical protein
VDVAKAPVSYALTGKWKGTARATGLVQLVTVDADRVAYWYTDLRSWVNSPGNAVVLSADGTAQLTRPESGPGVQVIRGTYRRAGNRIHIRFHIRTHGGTWHWDIAYVGPGKWRPGAPPD